MKIDWQTFETLTNISWSSTSSSHGLCALHLTQTKITYHQPRLLRFTKSIEFSIFEKINGEKYQKWCFDEWIDNMQQVEFE